MSHLAHITSSHTSFSYYTFSDIPSSCITFSYISFGGYTFSNITSIHIPLCLITFTSCGSEYAGPSILCLHAIFFGSLVDIHLHIHTCVQAYVLICIHIYLIYLRTDMHGLCAENMRSQKDHVIAHRKDIRTQSIHICF